MLYFIKYVININEYKNTIISIAFFFIFNVYLILSIFSSAINLLEIKSP